jgi:hypothetical protein
VIRNDRPVSEPYARRCTDDICEMPEAITVPKGTWFLAGDFRGESDDSRFWGPVPTEAITGVVKYRTGRCATPDGSSEQPRARGRLAAATAITTGGRDV